MTAPALDRRHRRLPHRRVSRAPRRRTRCDRARGTGLGGHRRRHHRPGQGLALGTLRPRARALGRRNGVGLGLALAAVTAVIGQVDTRRTPSSSAPCRVWLWCWAGCFLAREQSSTPGYGVASGVAWAVGWLMTPASAWPCARLAGLRPERCAGLADHHRRRRSGRSCAKRGGPFARGMTIEVDRGAADRGPDRVQSRVLRARPGVRLPEHPPQGARRDPPALRRRRARA